MKLNYEQHREVRKSLIKAEPYVTEREREIYKAQEKKNIDHICNILNNMFNHYKFAHNGKMNQTKIIIDIKNNTEVIKLIEDYYHNIRINKKSFPRRCHGTASSSLTRCEIRENSSHLVDNNLLLLPLQNGSFCCKIHQSQEHHF